MSFRGLALFGAIAITTQIFSVSSAKAATITASPAAVQVRRDMTASDVSGQSTWFNYRQLLPLLAPSVDNSTTSESFSGFYYGLLSGEAVRNAILGQDARFERADERSSALSLATAYLLASIVAALALWQRRMGQSSLLSVGGEQ